MSSSNSTPPAPSRRAAQLGLGAAIVLLIACITLIVGASSATDTQQSNTTVHSSASR
jgi:hypothetical protein